MTQELLARSSRECETGGCTELHGLGEAVSFVLLADKRGDEEYWLGRWTGHRQTLEIWHATQGRLKVDHAAAFPFD